MERVVRAPVDGLFTTDRQIGELVRQAEAVGRLGYRGHRPHRWHSPRPYQARLHRYQGLKIGDVDPRGDAGYCDTVSEKARALGGAVLEAILAVYNR